MEKKKEIYPARNNLFKMGSFCDFYENTYVCLRSRRYLAIYSNGFQSFFYSKTDEQSHFLKVIKNGQLGLLGILFITNDFFTRSAR